MYSPKMYFTRAQIRRFQRRIMRQDSNGHRTMSILPRETLKTSQMGDEERQRRGSGRELAPGDVFGIRATQDALVVYYCLQVPR